MTPEEYIARLLDASTKKHKLLGEMLLLTQQQSQSIAEESIEKLEQLVSGKQEIIEAVNRLDEEFEVYFNRIKQVHKIQKVDELKGSGLNGVKELQDTIKSIVELIGQISVIEKRNSINAKSLLNRYGSEIKRINQEKKVNTAYTPGPVQQASYFIDKKK